MNGSRKLRVLLVAAEVSSSLYARRLLEQWQSEKLDVEAFGIGSEDMEELGFERLGKAEELAVVGVTEVLSNFSLIRKTFYDLINAAKTRKPDVILLLDYPDFNLRLAEKLKVLGFPIVYYISPQIWAWRQKRVHQIKRLVDKVLVLFPFEESFYKEYDVPVDFVGHPLLDEVDRSQFSAEERKLRRAKLGIGDNERLLGLMPGSRRSELGHHLDVQLQAAAEVLRKQPNTRLALLAAPGLDVDQLRAKLGEYDLPIILMKDDPFNMIQLCDAMISASGTATLMVGLMEVPMVIMYRMNGLTAFLAKRLVKNKTFGLINLVLGQVVAPEFFQEEANPVTLCDAVLPLLYDEGVASKMKSELAQARYRLGDRGVTERVASALREYERVES